MTSVAEKGVVSFFLSWGCKYLPGRSRYVKKFEYRGCYRELTPVPNATITAESAHNGAGGGVLNRAKAWHSILSNSVPLSQNVLMLMSARCNIVGLSPVEGVPGFEEISHALFRK